MEWVYKEIYLLIEPLWSTPASSQASKGAQNVLKMTKMTLQRKKLIKVITDWYLRHANGTILSKVSKNVNVGGTNAKSHFFYITKCD